MTSVLGFCIAVLAQASPPSGAGDSADPGRVALEANRAGQAWMDRFSLRSTVDFELDRGRGPERQRTTTIVRRDGEKFDAAGDFVELDGESDEAAESPSNHDFRYLSDGRWWFSRNTTVGQEKLTGGRSAKLAEYSNHALESNQFAFGLDGHFPGNQGRTLSELLLGAENRDVSERVVDGAECVVVSGNTDHGEIEVVLDPARSHVLVAAKITKTLDSRYEDQTLATHPRSKGTDSWSAELSEVSVDRFDEFHIPVKGTIRVTESKGGRDHRYVCRGARSEIDLSPDFAAGDAFKMDFAEGARVADWDLPGKQIGYIWTGGTMVPEGAAGRPGVSGNQRIQPDLGRSRLWGVLIAANVVFLIVLAGFYVRARRRRGHD